MAFGVDACQCHGNLLWRPAQLQEMLDNSKQNGVGVQLGLRACVPTALHTTALGSGAAVLPMAGVAGDFAADGAGCSAQYLCNGPDAKVQLAQTGQSQAVFRLELLIRFGGSGLHLLTLQDRRCCTSDLNPPWNKKL